MCGICGYAEFWDDERLPLMATSLVHRGPDVRFAMLRKQ